MSKSQQKMAEEILEKIDYKGRPLSEDERSLTEWGLKGFLNVGGMAVLARIHAKHVEPSYTFVISPRSLDTIIAALRVYQGYLWAGYSEAVSFSTAFNEIASDKGTPLDVDEVEELILSLNCGE